MAGDAWEVSLPARKSAVSGRPPVRPRRTVHAPDEEAAKRAGKKVLARDYAAYMRGLTLDLSDLALYYIDHADASGTYTCETAHEYGLMVKRYVAPNFARDADEVLPMDIESLYAFLKASGGRDGQGVSSNTVRKLHTILRAAYEFLVREGIVDASPMPAVRAPKYERVHRRALTERELARLVSMLEEEIERETNILRRNALFGALLDLKIGARVAEVCAITRADVNFARRRVLIDKQMSERGGLHVKPKTKGNHGNPRAIDLGKETIAEIRTHLEWQRT